MHNYIYVSSCVLKDLFASCIQSFHSSGICIGNWLSFFTNLWNNHYYSYL